MLKYISPAKLRVYPHISTFAAILLFTLSFTACNDGPKAPDVSNIKVSLESRRFDKDLASLDTAHLAAGLQQLRSKYPDFLDFYLDTLMGLGLQGNYSDTTDAVRNGLKPRLTHKDYRGLLDTLAVHFPDMSATDKQLASGFKYLLNYFPKYHVPKITYSVFWLNKLPAFIMANGDMGINLDMFLGPRYPYYKSVGVEDFMAKHLAPEYIPVAVFSVISDDIYPYQAEGRNLLDLMIQRGKQQYFLSKVLPFTDDTLRLGYSKAELKGCDENRAQIYNFFIKNNLLYDTHIQVVYRFVNDGPSTGEIAKQCPGNIGTWLGYEIVKAYMKEHPATTLEQLMHNTDAQKFLQESKYNPK